MQLAFIPQLDHLQERIVACTRCPRLVAHRQEAARVKRAAFRHHTYWGKPVPGFGDPQAHVLIVGLAPAAHGGNRTGRMFTGDSSGDFLYAALYRAGFANQPVSISRDDGMQLRDVYITAAARCAPPDNKPTSAELDTCRPFLIEELRLLSNLRVIVALGKIGFEAALAALAAIGQPIPRPRPTFSHGGEHLAGRYIVLGCYHPSQRNTSTGLVTPAMYDRVLERAKQLGER